MVNVRKSLKTLFLTENQKNAVLKALDWNEKRARERDESRYYGEVGDRVVKFCRMRAQPDFIINGEPC